jgi:hypothetical protein
MLQRMFGYWVRREACRLAAQAAQGPWSQGRDVSHLLWSLAVFFENYIRHGQSETMRDFGPKGPVDLGIVRAPQEKGLGEGA